MTNGDKYRTSDDRFNAFDEHCKNCGGHNCSISMYVHCVLNWLDLPATCEKTLPCPFCGGKCSCAFEYNGRYRVKCDASGCWYSSPLYMNMIDAIMHHNRVVRAVAASKGRTI